MFSTTNLDRFVVLTLGLVLGRYQVNAAPCDIYATGNTPCVAAHSTTRALFDAYSGPLYQVIRSSDGATEDISTLSAGSVANAGTQDTFCSGTTCVISVIYDQTDNHNDLTPAPPGGEAAGPGPDGHDLAASAVGAPVTLNGQKAYGVFIEPTSGYRNDGAKDIPTGSDPQGIYAVLDGTHYNSNCCFDYGNGEVNNDNNGNGHMEAVYFGTSNGYGTGAGNGPWILADLENGLYASSGGVNPNDPTFTTRFVTAVVKGEPGTWSIRGGDATQGSLTTFWDGVRPTPGYEPMSKEGAIILGIGGDNSNGAQGTFYEGVMTSGYPSDDTENAVQQDVINAGYAPASLVSGPAFTIGSIVTLRATTACCTGDYISHSSSAVSIQSITGSSSTSAQQAASWTVRTGLGNDACYSFESVDSPGSFLRHYAFQIRCDTNDGSKIFSEDATYCPQSGLDGQGSSIRSWSFPTRFFRHYNGALYLASDGGPEDFDAAFLFNNDTSFVMGMGFSPVS